MSKWSMPPSRRNPVRSAWKPGSPRHVASLTLSAKAKAATRHRPDSLACCRTRKPIPDSLDIEEAFSVEAVTKEFFNKYAELFEDIHQGAGETRRKDKTIRDEFKAKNVNTVDFAKKLMGQIVFLYFLQKKGWLGVAKGQDWGTGPRDFLRRLCQRRVRQVQQLLNDILELLFYDTLATDRGHEAWCSRFKCRIPFLNGGLFEALGDYDWKKTDILLPE